MGDPLAVSVADSAWLMLLVRLRDEDVVSEILSVVVRDEVRDTLTVDDEDGDSDVVGVVETSGVLLIVTERDSVKEVLDVIEEVTDVESELL